MSEDQKPPYLREWLTSQGNVYAFLASTAAAAVLSIPFGFGIGALPLIAFVAGDAIASMFIPASITYREKIDRKYRQQARQDARNHLLDEISRRSPNGKQYDRTLNIFAQMRQRIDSLYRLAGDHGSQFSERDIDKLDEASMDYLYAKLALLVIEDRAASIDLKEIDERVRGIERELTAPPMGADVRQLQKARADYQALAARHRRMLSRRTALEAAVLSMPDQMEEIYQMIVAAPRSHELGVKLSEAVGNLRLREEIEGEVADDLQSSIPGIVVPLHQTNARRAAAQTAA